MAVEQRQRCEICNRQIEHQPQLGPAACPRCADEAAEFDMTSRQEHDRAMRLLIESLHLDDE